MVGWIRVHEGPLPAIGAVFAVSSGRHQLSFPRSRFDSSTSHGRHLSAEMPLLQQIRA